MRLRSVEIGLVTGIAIEIEVGTAAETETGTEEIETAGETAMLIQAEIAGIETIVIEIEIEIVGGIGIAMAEVLVGTIAGGKEIAVTIEAATAENHLLVRNLLKLIERSSVNRGRSTI
jgi:hypothetical protein